MRKIIFCLIFVLFATLTACDVQKNTEYVNGENTITDCLGNSCTLPDNPRIVSCYGSFSECWLLSGGTLLGVTDDAITERNLNIHNSATVVGTVKDINLELVISLSPDYVILSNEIASHKQLAPTLTDMGIDFGYFQIDNFRDYDNLMAQFCKINKRDDLYKQNVTEVSDKINLILSQVPECNDKSYIVMRVYSTGIKVKTDNIADNIIREFNITNITDNNPSLLLDLSIEHIISENPDYIFVLTMGDENAAHKYIRENIESNPAWNSLQAVRNNNYFILPKNLFHYKPNNRWDESYEYIAKIIYPEIFGEHQNNN